MSFRTETTSVLHRFFDTFDPKIRDTTENKKTLKVSRKIQKHFFRCSSVSVLPIPSTILRFRFRNRFHRRIDWNRESIEVIEESNRNRLPKNRFTKIYVFFKNHFSGEYFLYLFDISCFFGCLTFVNNFRQQFCKKA